jgi:type II secretory pathway pseudopilin PulG
MRTSRHIRGLTLVEVMASMGLVAVALLALVSANTLASRASSHSYQHFVAMRLAQQRLDLLMLGDQKSRLPAMGSPPAFTPDATPLDCQEVFGDSGVSASLLALCNGTNPALVGWVDYHGRPCRRTGAPEEGFHPTCQYRRYVRYTRVSDPAATADLWRISVAVSHASNGQCQSFTGNDYECVVTSTVLTR